jgi:hypothetical protein
MTVIYKNTVQNQTLEVGTDQCHFHKTSLCVKNPIMPSMGDRNG